MAALAEVTRLQAGTTNGISLPVPTARNYLLFFSRSINLLISFFYLKAGIIYILMSASAQQQLLCISMYPACAAWRQHSPQKNDNKQRSLKKIFELQKCTSFDLKSAAD